MNLDSSDYKNFNDSKINMIAELSPSKTFKAESCENEENLIDIISPNLKTFLTFIITEFKGKIDLVTSLINLSAYLFDQESEYIYSYDAFAFFILFMSNLYK